VRDHVAEVDGKEIEFDQAPDSELVRDGGGSTWDLDAGSCVAGLRTGTQLETVAVTPVYWLAWSSFYPNTEVVD
jgi:hypothetical protein